MDAIDELADQIAAMCCMANKSPLARRIAEILHAEQDKVYGVTPPSPPEPGSLWEHKETGERRFVYDIYETWPQVLRFIPTNPSESGPSAMSMTDWHAWSSNADELVKGVG